MNSAENKQEAGSSAKCRSKLLHRWVISLVVVLLSEPLEWLLGWVPLFSAAKALIVMVVLLEGKVAMAVAKRLDGRLEAMEKKAAGMCDFVAWFAGVMRLSLCIWLLEWSRPSLQTASSSTLLTLTSLCQTYQSDISSFLSSQPPPSNPPMPPPSKPPPVLEILFHKCDPLKTPSRPKDDISLDTSATDISEKDVKSQPQTPAKDESASFGSANKLFSQTVKPPPTPSVHRKKQSIASEKDSSWTITVQILTKRSPKSLEHAYLPYMIWYEPTKRTLFWHAVGEEAVSSDTLVGAKITSRAGLMMQLEVTGGTKVVRFGDVEKFVNWSQRLLRSITKS